MAATSSHSLAIDIGGTFTDVVCAGGEAVHVFKVPSTRPDQSGAVAHALDRLMESSESPPNHSAGRREEFHSKIVTDLNSGDRPVIATVGGWGDPTKRDREAVRKDLADGKIGQEAAHTVYGLADG